MEDVFVLSAVRTRSASTEVRDMYISWVAALNGGLNV